MKIGLAVYGDLAGRSGGYLYDRMLVDHLRRHGDSVEVIALPGRCSTPSLLTGLDPRLLRRLLNLDVDVLIEDELCHHPFALLNGRLRKEVSYPLVGLFHFLASRAEPNMARVHRLEVIERRFASTLDGGIFNSASTEAAARELAPYLAGVVARPGRDHVQLSEVRRERSIPLNILFLGSISPGKGLDVLLRALALLPRGRFRVEVAGPTVDVSYLQEVRSLVDRCSLADEVNFWGWAGEQDREKLLSSTDVLAVPSLYEGYGLVFVEALAFGVPVIAPLNGGAREIITEGEQGFLVEAGDHRTVARHLRSLEQDHEMLEEMSAKAKERYLALPTWEEEMGRAREYLHKLGSTR